jgi:hypothetical protein
MARGWFKLTDRRCYTAKAGRYSDGHGLYLDVEGPNSKHWTFIYQRPGSAERVGARRALSRRQSRYGAGRGGADTERYCDR